MDSFLNEIVNIISNKYKDYQNITIVFPSRRAGLYFKNYISKIIQYPCWGFEILSLTDFMSKYSDLEIKESSVLIWELYDIYKKYFPAETPDSFLYWGNIIINDFDIIDKYLVEDTKIFKAIRDWKEIEEMFPTELPEEYETFWKSIKDFNSVQKESFLKTWEVLGKIYKDFTTILKSKKIAYEGLAFRELYNSLISGTKINREKIIFAGFYSFSKSEEEIISYLLKNSNAELYFDLDNYYLEDNDNEAGKSLRKSINKFKYVIEKNKLEQKDYIFLIDSKSLINENKKINIIGAPLQAGMAKVLGNLLSDLIKNDNENILYENLNNTAIILPDESILLQVLYSIPEEIKDFNVTVGFPFKDTSLYSLLLLIQDLHNNSIKKDDKILFHYSDIERILLHPYIRFSDIAIVFRILNTIYNKNIVYTSLLYSEEFKAIFDNINDDSIEIIKKVFTGLGENTIEIYNYLKNIILSIAKRIENSKDEYYKKFQFEYLYYFYNELEKLFKLISKYNINLSINNAFKVIMTICGKMHIPFTGEPIKGLQIMGIFESRNLDFENVYILSLNEGVFPSSGYENSFIPYNLRKAFGLPTYEDKSAIEAYLFYRLLQRAKNVNLLYDTEINNNIKGKSRYIYQIEKDIFKSHKGLNNKIFSFKLPYTKPIKIEIKKTEDLIQTSMNFPHLSPSAIITYIECKLKFYFERIINLEEIKTPAETLDEVTIGSIFHKIMELIYKDYIGKTISKKIIEKLKGDFDTLYEDLFYEAIDKISYERKTNINFEHSEKNKFLKYVIKDFVKNALEADKNFDFPIEIYALESIVEAPIDIKISNAVSKRIILKGIIDRIDKIDNKFRIVDYKTGYSHFLNFSPNNKDGFFEKIFSDTKYKDSFQIFFYLYISLSKLTENEFTGAILYPREKKSKYVEIEKITKNDLLIFEEYLIKLLNEIYNLEIPFSQTEDEKKCEYCPYKHLCYR